MKSKIKFFEQYLCHAIDDEDKADDYLYDALPSIGEVIVFFNGLERSLNSVLWEWFTDRTDSMGLIVMGSMQYSAKVDLLKRLCDDFHFNMGVSTLGYSQIVQDLQECARLRNLVAHADWESINEDAYAFVKLRISKNGIQQEYVQFTKESLDRIVELILRTRSELSEFSERLSDILCGRV